MRFPSLRTILATTSSLFYCLRQGIVFWRTTFPETADDTSVDEVIDDALRDAGHAINNVGVPVSEHLADGELDEKELIDIYQRLRELREGLNFIPLDDKDKEL